MCVEDDSAEFDLLLSDYKLCGFKLDILYRFEFFFTSISPF